MLAEELGIDAPEGLTLLRWRRPGRGGGLAHAGLEALPFTVGRRRPEAGPDGAAGASRGQPSRGPVVGAVPQLEEGVLRDVCKGGADQGAEYRSQLQQDPAVEVAAKVLAHAFGEHAGEALLGGLRGHRAGLRRGLEEGTTAHGQVGDQPWALARSRCWSLVASTCASGTRSR